MPITHTLKTLSSLWSKIDADNEERVFVKYQDSMMYFNIWKLKVF